MWTSIKEIFALLLTGTTPLQKTIVTIVLLICLTVFGVYYLQMKTYKAVASEVPENMIVKSGGEVHSIEKTTDITKANSSQ